MDGHKWRLGPVAAGVNGSGDNAFARAAFATQQDGRFAWRGPKCHIERLTHDWFVGLQIGLRYDRTDLVFQQLDLRLQSADSRHPVEYQSNLVRRENGLGKKSNAPRAYGLDGKLDRGIRGDHNDGQPGR